jgi:hypothetical protein
MSEQIKITPASIKAACKEMLSHQSIVGSFTLKNKQVCEVKKSDKKTAYVPLCDPFEVLGRTYDEDGDNSGLVIRFAADRAKRPIIETTVALSELVADPKKVVAALAGKGLWVSGKRDAIGKVGELLSLIRPENDVVTASRPGWYDEVFVSPTGEVFGASETHYRLAEAVQYSDPEKSGDIDGWLHATRAALECANGDFLCMGLLSGFAGTLVNLMQEPTSVLLNFAGTTSRGKTTAQRIGASVLGNPIRGAALVKFNVTPNAIEAIAERANGTLLAIDEGGQSNMTGPQYQTAVFNLAEGSGKHRLTAAAAERKVRRWATCITISEEIGFADKVKRDGRNPAAGAVARSWEIDVDDAELLDDETVAKMDGIRQNYGHAAPVFIQYLIDQGYPKHIDRLSKRVKDAETFLSNVGDAPQKRRVSGAAAILLVAGELAQEVGLIHVGYDLRGAVKRVLERSYSRMARDMDPIDTALVNLQEGILRRLGVDVRELYYDQDTVHREVVAYYGYSEGPYAFSSDDKQRQDYERVYFIPVDQMMALGGGNVTPAAIARALNSQGYLLTPDKKNSQWPTMPSGEKIKHYRVSGSFFHEIETVSKSMAAE